MHRLLLFAVLFTAGSLSARAAAQERSGCVLHGDVAPKAKLQVFDKPSGGRVTATLSGVRIPIRLSGLATQPLQHRARINTTRAGGYLRIEGWLAIDNFRFYAARDLQLAHGLVWISQSQRITIDAVGAKDFTVRHRILGSQDQVLIAQVPCDAISLAISAPAPIEIPKRAHTFQMKHDALALYERPDGQAVFTLQMHKQARKPFWSTKYKGRFVHLVSRADVTIDAWAQRKDLTSLRRGEVFSQRVPVPIPQAAREIRMQDPPKVRTATKEMPVFLKPGDKAEPVGFLEIGTKFYRFEIAHGWTKILPADLGLLPPGEQGFWVHKSATE